MKIDTTLWLVRHGERVDNVDPTWRERAPRGAWDDPPLTARGLQQAVECGRRLANERIDHIFCSPFLRCVQTATQIVNEFERPASINIEPGICETLYICQDPPGHLTTVELHGLFPHIDPTYEAVMPRPAMDCRSEKGTMTRMRATLDGIREKYHGNLLFVSHGVQIASAHCVLTGKPWQYVGQCTLSKFVPKPMTNTTNFADEHHRQAVTEFIDVMHGNSEHLSDQTNLRGGELKHKPAAEENH